MPALVKDEKMLLCAGLVGVQLIGNSIYCAVRRVTPNR